MAPVQSPEALPARSPEEVFALLVRERPRLHGAHDGTTLTESAVWDWSLHPDVLRWLMAHIQPGFRTLETGCGYSTIVFALKACRHEAVSPFPEEHRSIDDWCRAHGASLGTVAWRTGSSHRVLPALDPTPLDLVLVDGDHGVPMPLVDFCYTADRLVEGGWLLVDDVQLPSVEQLCEFLDAETPRWAFAEQLARTRIYRKRAAGRVTGILWNQQPFCAEPPPGRARRRPLYPPPRRRPQHGLLYRVLRRIKRAVLG
jgi:predicted O-methyltransferase YrrM